MLRENHLYPLQMTEKELGFGRKGGLKDRCLCVILGRQKDEIWYSVSKVYGT